MSVDYFTRVQATQGWARILDSFTRFVDPQPGQRTLDVGCGPGALVRRLAHLGCRAMGVDADPAMVARATALASGLGGMEYRAANVLSLPFADQAFEVVTATNVIFLLPEPLAGLREMRRVCRRGGLVAMLNPSPRLSRASALAHARAAGLKDFEEISLTNWGSVADSHRRFSPDDLRDLFAAARLQSPEITEKIGPGLALFVKGRRAS